MDLVIRWFGLFVYDGDKLMEYVPFPEDPDEIARRIGCLKNLTKIGEIEEIEELKRKYGELKIIDKEIPATDEDDGELLRRALFILGEQELERVGLEVRLITLVNELNKVVEFRAELKNFLHKDERSVKSLKALEKELRRDIYQISKEVLPNCSAVAGEILAAKLLAKAGSLSQLARFPAGTIQTLGAEKALFRHLSDGSKPPKYGLLFQHPKIAKADRKGKGKLARKIACNLAIAARADYAHRNIEKFLIERMEYVT